MHLLLGCEHPREVGRPRLLLDEQSVGAQAHTGSCGTLVRSSRGDVKLAAEHLRPRQQKSCK